MAALYPLAGVSGTRAGQRAAPEPAGRAESSAGWGLWHPRRSAGRPGTGAGSGAGAGV